MTRFEYVSVLISIIIAFGVAEIISGWGQRILHPERFRPFWIQTAWTGLILLLMVQFWWGFWQCSAPCSDSRPSPSCC